MKRLQSSQEWLEYFKLAVTQAAHMRLSGNTERAQGLDRTVEAYYEQANREGLFNEDFLYENESGVRNSLK